MPAIPIALATDNNNVFALGVVLYSALKNAKPDTFYDFYVMCARDVESCVKEKILTLKEQFPNCEIHFIDMAGQFENVKKTHDYVTTPSAYKMTLAEKLPHLDKILYLDTDVLVRDDLQELFRFDLEDNYIAGAPVIVNHLNCYSMILTAVGLPDMSYYVNAGVLLMNLKKIREDGIDKTWQSLLGTFKGSVDQHILNKVCYGKIGFIPVKFNVDPTAMPFFASGELSYFYSIKEYTQAFENPSIFHWAGHHKPWNYRRVYLSHEWFKYFIKSPFREKEIRVSLEKERGFRTINFWRLPLLGIESTPLKTRYSLFGVIPLINIRRIW